MSLTLFAIVFIFSFRRICRITIRRAARATPSKRNSTFAQVLFAPARTRDGDQPFRENLTEKDPATRHAQLELGL